MGIKGLWAVLSPYSEKKSLHEIRGETVAVDLSGWICDSQNVTEYYIQPKLYLRNLFFRTAYLVLADIKPVFVLEGDAPELKRDVMAARNAIQFRGAAPRTDTACNKKPDVARRRFKGVLKECETLLKCLGVSCVKGAGEAEATCAVLNAQGLVDAVVSQDSDCFAYGAKRVYRNFSVSSSAGGGALQGSVDSYDATKMYNSNGFGRNKMVALAILCGCDYGVGACGSSVNTVVSFLHTVPESDVIPRLLSWVCDPESYEEKSRWVAAPGRCDRCGHVGRTHSKNGCPVCATHRGCEDMGHKAKVSEVKRELSLRSRAVSCGMPFPEPKVMKEFLNRPPEQIDMEKLKNPAPNLIQFVKLMTYKLDWSEKYCVEKFLPILTKWHLQEHVPCRTIKAAAIKKKRTPRGVPSFEVVWSDVDGQYDCLIPDDQFEEGEDPLVAWTTIERQDVMRQFYPELVEAFEEATKKPQKEKKSRKKTNENPERPKRKYNKKPNNVVIDYVNVSTDVVKSSELNTSKLNVSVSVNKLKRKIKSNKKGQTTIDSFIANKKRKTQKKDMRSLRLSMKNLSIVTDNKGVGIFEEFKYSDDLFDGKVNDVINSENNRDDNKENVVANNGLSFLEKTDDPANDSELSDIIDKIVATAPETRTAEVDNHLVRLVFDKYSTPKKDCVRKSILARIHNNCSTPNESPKAFRFSNSCNNSIVGNAKANTSYFFDKLTEDVDAFEMSLHKSVINLDSTVDYSLPDVCL